MHVHTQKAHFPSILNHRHLFLVQISLHSPQYPNSSVLCGRCPQAYIYHNYSGWEEANNPSLSVSTIDYFLEISKTLPLNINYKRTDYPIESKNAFLRGSNSNLMDSNKHLFKTDGKQRSSIAVVQGFCVMAATLCTNLHSCSLLCCYQS